jgi:hypothetical protein
MGVRKDLAIMEENYCVEGLDNHLLQISVKYTIRGKEIRFKILGIYAPIVGAEKGVV